MRQIHWFPIQVWPQVHINDSHQRMRHRRRCKIRRFLICGALVAKCKSQSTLIGQGVTTCRGRRWRRGHIQLLLSHNATYSYTHTFMLIHTYTILIQHSYTPIHTILMHSYSDTRHGQYLAYNSLVCLISYNMLGNVQIWHLHTRRKVTNTKCLF